MENLHANLIEVKVLSLATVQSCDLSQQEIAPVFSMTKVENLHANPIEVKVLSLATVQSCDLSQQEIAPVFSMTKVENLHANPIEVKVLSLATVESCDITPQEIAPVFSVYDWLASSRSQQLVKNHYYQQRAIRRAIPLGFGPNVYNAHVGTFWY